MPHYVVIFDIRFKKRSAENKGVFEKRILQIETIEK